jgi:hypothetical protein
VDERAISSTHLIDPQSIRHPNRTSNQHPSLPILDSIQQLSLFPRSMSRHLHLTLGTLVGVGLTFSGQVFGKQKDPLDQSYTGRSATQFYIGDITL